MNNEVSAPFRSCPWCLFGT